MGPKKNKKKEENKDSLNKQEEAAIDNSQIVEDTKENNSLGKTIF